MAIDVDSVATDADLESHVLGKSQLQDLIPDEWLNAAGTEKTARNALVNALRDVLSVLANMTPRILEDDITTPADLKQVVCFSALESMYTGKATHVDSPNFKIAEFYRRKYSAAMQGLRPETSTGVSTNSISVRLYRG